MTPVIETYSQSGSVQRAMLRCRKKSPRNARLKVTITSGTIKIANTTCVVRIVK